MRGRKSYVMVAAMACLAGAFAWGETPEAEEGLLLKQDFEGPNVVLRHWAGTKDKTVEIHELSKEVFHSGKQSEHLKITYQPGGPKHDYWTVARCNVALTPGSMIEVSAWVKADAPLDLRIAYMATGIKWGGGVLRGDTYRGTGEWEEIKLTAVAEKVARSAKGVESAKKAGYDGTQPLILFIVGLNFRRGASAIDVYIDDVKVHSRLPVELAGIEADREKVSKLLATPEGKEFTEKFEEIYKKLDLIKELLASEDSPTRVAAQKKAAELIPRYKELKRELTFSQL